jgi:hypothetical protein
MQASEHCATFASRDGGGSWTRHDVALPHCGDPQAGPARRSGRVRRARRFPGHRAGARQLADRPPRVTTPDGRFRAMWPEMRDGHSVLLTTAIEVNGHAVAPAAED